MKNITLLLLLFPCTLFGQLSASLSVDVSACVGTSGQSITFTGANGTLPYTFTYAINGGAPQTISTSSGSSVSVPISTASAGTFTYNLTQVEDNLGTIASISDQAIANVYALPIVSAGVDQTICIGASVTLSGSGAITYSWNNGVTNGVSFSPVSTATYTVTGMSAYGCINADQVVVTVSQLPLVNAGPDPNICNGGSIVLSGGGALTYNWSPPAGLSSSTSANPIASPAVTTTYTLSGINAVGCMATDQVTVYVMPITPTLPSASIDSSYCNDGSIQLTSSQTGSSVVWQNGATSSQLTNLSPGTYTGTFTDGNGCQSSISYYVPLSVLGSSCPELSGSVHMDYNSDCLVNGVDNQVANRMIVANPGNYLTITDQNGNYSMNLPIGTYVVEEIMNDPNYLIGCTPNYSVPLLSYSDSIGGLNFMDTLVFPIDVSTTIFSTGIVPGFNFNLFPQYYCTSSGVPVETFDAWIKIPSGVLLTGWAHPHTQSNDTLYFSLSGFSSPNNILNFIANQSLPLGMALSFCSGIEIAAGEQNILNNIYCHTTMVVGSFDPNDKTMFLNGVQSDSTIFVTDETLEYVIRFQNTGTAPAQNIYILDTINSTLNLNTFQFLSSSHNCTTSIEEGNVLKFSFPQIFLPDSTNNEPESHGFVHYRIRQSNQNTTGTVINNTAYIYFDFNEAVVTNTTYDEIVIDDLGISEGQIFNVKLFPNPTESILNVESESIIEAISIYTLNGQLVKQLSLFSQKATVDLSELTQGVYLVEIHSEKGRIVKRIVVE